MKLKERIISLRKDGKTYSQIQAKLRCSKGIISFHIGTGVKERQIKRQQNNRTESIRGLKILHGGKCKVCGYSRCLKALEFHHSNPKEKDFDISSRNLSFKQIATEAKKCTLLCSNCHRELHDGLIEL